jgi:acetylornithine deacetylase/succinyl-diaminopimelate desuccinylase-like protein
MLKCAPRLCQQNFCRPDQLFRQLGIAAYGWAPIYTPEEDEGAHGNNERISVENVRQGTREFY